MGTKNSVPSGEDQERIARIDEDIEILVTDYEFRDRGVTQFYVGSTLEVFEQIMEEIRLRAHIPAEKCIDLTAITVTTGGLSDLLEREPLLGTVGGYLIKVYGAVEKIGIGHPLNQSVSTRYFHCKPNMIGIHVNSSLHHNTYAWAIKIAKDSQFQVRVIEL